jgi:hypothetical protein
MKNDDYMTRICIQILIIEIIEMETEVHGLTGNITLFMSYILKSNSLVLLSLSTLNKLAKY